MECRPSDPMAAEVSGGEGVAGVTGVKYRIKTAIRIRTRLNCVGSKAALNLLSRPMTAISPGTLPFYSVTPATPELLQLLRHPLKVIFFNNLHARLPVGAQSFVGEGWARGTGCC